MPCRCILPRMNAIARELRENRLLWLLIVVYLTIAMTLYLMPPQAS